MFFKFSVIPIPKDIWAWRRALIRSSLCIYDYAGKKLLRSSVGHAKYVVSEKELRIIPGLQWSVQKLDDPLEGEQLVCMD